MLHFNCFFFLPLPYALYPFVVRRKCEKGGKKMGRKCEESAREQASSLRLFYPVPLTFLKYGVKEKKET